MQLRAGFVEFLKEWHLYDPSIRLLVAVSGGIDSVVLTHLCKQEGLNIAIAHCNFRLRGEESERDEAFVTGLAERYKAPLFIQRFDTADYAEKNKLSIQEAARDLRYNWFASLKQEHHFHYILLAHHLNDNIETLVMNFFRGTGLEGLTGMPVLRSSAFLRPLLFAERKDIELYAAENKLQWVEDSSNESSKYTRNYFRNELLPQLKKVYPSVESNLSDNIHRFQKTKDLFDMLVADLKKKLLTKVNDEVRIPVALLLRYHHTSLIYEIIKEYGFGEKQVADVWQLCNSVSGKFIQNENYQVIRHRKWLVITPVLSEVKETIAIDQGEEGLTFALGNLRITSSGIGHFKLKSDALLAQLDEKNLAYPLVIRKWKEGDYFYPLGMPKKKKLARFFIDQKLSKADKEKVWVLESAQRIVWVIGMRIDHRFRITEKTKNVVIIALTKLGS